MKIESLKRRVKFTRKKKCDVCKQIKMVTHECEDCYDDGFMKSMKNYKEKKK